MVQIDPPTSSITTSQVFKDSTDASAAVMGIYAKMINTTNPAFTSGAITIYAGMSSDELIDFEGSDDDNSIYTNSIHADNGNVYTLWAKAYPIIYQANATIEGLLASNTISLSTKDQFIGEAKFLRSFCYFYLINLFGDVPYITSTAFSKSSVTGRVSRDQIYQYIINDLKDCESSLKSDYSISNGERIRVNKWAVKSLLARIYLYRQNWDSAISEATAVINQPLYGLDSLNGVFLKNSSEAILQFGLNPMNSPTANETPEGRALIPPRLTSYPYYYCSPLLLNAFEIGDQRRAKWIDSTIYSGTTYLFPYKYKIGRAQYSIDGATEYYMVLRLAEQYLIRAEAIAHKGNVLTDAINDINIIRERAGLSDLSLGLTQTQVLAAIVQERQTELFAEWGHRWLDLKRTNMIDQVMVNVTPNKNGGGTWNTYQQLYPIPYLEISSDPNLTQNSGY